MRILKAATYGLIALAGLAAAPAYASFTNLQGVTFTTTFISSSSFSLTITNADDATGNWATATHLHALGVKSFGDWDTATVVPSGSVNGHELNNGFCINGNPDNAACFTFSPDVAVSDSMVFTFTFTGSNITADMVPHIKVGFLCPGETTACGSLLSQDVAFGDDDDDDDDDDTDVPEPGSLALLGLGLLGLGLSRRRK